MSDLGKPPRGRKKKINFARLKARQNPPAENGHSSEGSTGRRSPELSREKNTHRLSSNKHAEVSYNRHPHQNESPDDSETGYKSKMRDSPVSHMQLPNVNHTDNNKYRRRKVNDPDDVDRGLVDKGGDSIHNNGNSASSDEYDSVGSKLRRESGMNRRINDDSDVDSEKDFVYSSELEKDSLKRLNHLHQAQSLDFLPSEGRRNIVDDYAGLLAKTDPGFNSPIDGLTFKHSTDMLSTHSFRSNSSHLSNISTKQAKQRSLLYGSFSTGGGAFLGPEEMNKLFPEGKIKIFVGTWNMNEKNFEEMDKLTDLLLPESLDAVADMYVIGTQESCPDKREWEIQIQETLGPHHVLFHSTSLGALHLMIFLRRDLIWYCSAVDDDTMQTKVNPTKIKTKGAVAICFTLFGTSFLFINTHFKAHSGKAKERIADYHNINTKLNLPQNLNKHYAKNEEVTARFDCTFWCGDLNFRLERVRENVDKALEGIQNEDFESLLAHDELQISRQ